MTPMGWMRGVLALALLLAAGVARAGDPCPAASQRLDDPLVANRIAAVACAEHLRWDRPFIDAEGRLASANVYEAEASGLADGTSPWRRVAQYWRATGLLASTVRPGASDCEYATSNPSYPGMGCRGFVIDTPWSATFISWVELRAGVPGFTLSASHFEYVRASRVNPAGSPYRWADPRSARLEVGDMLCFVRSGRLYGTSGLADAADRGAGLPMHCDLVVGVESGRAYLIGGNVQQAVTMRMLNLNAAGEPWGLPQRAAGTAACSPDLEDACNFNRQDWAVVLKLKSQEELAQIGPVRPRGYPIEPPTGAPTCCVRCVVGSGVPRCPGPGTAPAAQQAAEPVPLQGSD